MESIHLSGLNLMLALLGLLCFTYLSWQQIRAGIYMILLGLPSYQLRLTLASVPITVLECAILILFIIWLWKDTKWKRINLHLWRQNPDNPLPMNVRWPLIILLVSAAIATLFAPDTRAALGLLKAYFIEPYLFFLVAVYELKTQKHIERALIALGFLVLIIGSIAWWQYLTGMGIANPFWAAAETRRITTFFGYPNANSLLVGPIIGLYIGYLFKRDVALHNAFKVLVILFGIIVLYTAHSAGALGALAVVLWLIIARRKTMRKILVGITLLGLIALVLVPGPRHAWSVVYDKVSRNYLDLHSSSLEIRINQWRETVALLKAHPIRGAGLGGYQAAVAPYHQYKFLEIYLYPHSLLLNFYVELGILGLISILWLFIVYLTLLYSLIKRKLLSSTTRSLILGCIFAWLMILIHGLVDVPFFKNDLSILWMFLSALPLVLSNALKQRTNI